MPAADSGLQTAEGIRSPGRKAMSQVRILRLQTMKLQLLRLKMLIKQVQLPMMLWIDQAILR